MTITNIVNKTEAKTILQHENIFGKMDPDTVTEILENHYKQLEIKDLIELLKVSYLHNIEMQLAQPQSAKEEVWYS